MLSKKMPRTFFPHLIDPNRAG